jgi:hypothetical protein
LGTDDTASESTSSSVPTAFALVFTLDLHHGMLLAFLALGRERRVPRFLKQAQKHTTFSTVIGAMPRAEKERDACQKTKGWGRAVTGT